MVSTTNGGSESRMQSVMAPEKCPWGCTEESWRVQRRENGTHLRSGTIRARIYFIGCAFEHLLLTGISDTLTTVERRRRLQGTHAFNGARLDRERTCKTRHATSGLCPYTGNLVFFIWK